MATGTTITTKSGKRGFFPTEILPFLQAAKSNYIADSKGMADGGMCLSSSFISYCELDKMHEAMTKSGQVYKFSVAHYAAAYNQLFSIDC